MIAGEVQVVVAVDFQLMEVVFGVIPPSIQITLALTIGRDA